MTDEPTTPASGMRDFLADEVRRRNHVFETIRDTYESYGFEPLETPSLERLSTLLGKYGEEEKLIFKVLKRGQKLRDAIGSDDVSEDELADLALRYDLTVPLARIVAEYPNDLPRFYKRYQIQPVWRADRPQKGRFREFFQCDIDIIGSESVVAEAELCAAVTDALRELGFDSFRIHTNHRQLLRALMEVADIPTDLRSEALIAIDKLDKIGRDGVIEELENRGIERDSVDTLMPLLDRADEPGEPPFGDQNADTLDALADDIEDVEQGREAIDDLRTFTNYLEGSNAGEHVFIDPYLARGLSYYTGPIFEITSDDFDGSLAGGGRYDDLIGMFTNRDLPACGLSIGVERILVLLEERGYFDTVDAPGSEPPADVMVTVFNEELAGASRRLAAEFRQAGFRTDVYPTTEDGLGKQFGYADERDIPYVALVAPKEHEQGVVALQHMESGEKSEVPRDNAVDWLADELTGRSVRDGSSD